MSGVEGIVRDMILVYSSTKYFILLASDVVAEGLNFKGSFAKMPLKKKKGGEGVVRVTRFLLERFHRRIVIH